MTYSDETLVRIADILKVLAEPMRLRIIQALHDGELSVSALLEKTGGRQANVSKHLGILRRMGLVTCRKDGLMVMYRLSDDGIFSICDSICDYLKRRLHREQAALASIAGEADRP